MSDLRLELRFKNARLFNLIEERFRAERGNRYGCCFLAADKIGISRSFLNGLLTLRLSPWVFQPRKKGDSPRERLTPVAEKIADYFGCDPYWLFPINLYRLRIPGLVTKEMESERFVSLQEARAQKLLPSYVEADFETATEQSEIKDKIDEVLLTLSPREAEVLTERFGLDGNGERTLEELAEKFYVTRERIRQIEHRALSKLRHPDRSRKLRDL